MLASRARSTRATATALRRGRRALAFLRRFAPTSCARRDPCAPREELSQRVRNRSNEIELESVSGSRRAITELESLSPGRGHRAAGRHAGEGALAPHAWNQSTTRFARDRIAQRASSARSKSCDGVPGALQGPELDIKATAHDGKLVDAHGNLVAGSKPTQDSPQDPRAPREALASNTTAAAPAKNPSGRHGGRSAPGAGRRSPPRARAG